MNHEPPLSTDAAAGGLDKSVMPEILVDKCTSTRRAAMRLRMLLLAIFLLVVSAPPASAKEGFRPTMTGPGISTPEGIALPPTITVMSARATGAPPLNVDAKTARVVPSGTLRNLGPRYRIVFTWKILRNGSGSGEFVQYFYPHAQGGPVLHVPGGQRFHRWRDSADARTFQIDGTVEDGFRWLGYRDPAAAVALLPRPAASPVARLESDSAGINRFVVGALAGVTALLAGAGVLVVRRRAVQPGVA